MITDEEMAAMEWRRDHNDGPWPNEAQRDRRRLLVALRAERAGVAGIEEAARTVILALEAEVEELRDHLAAAADVINARED